MFSIITTASSTTKPVEMVSAMSERLFRLKPSPYMTANVPTIDTGTVMPGMNVAAALRRNTKMTRTTRTTASISSNWTSWTEARMVVVRSVSTVTCTADGRALWSCGRSCLTRSTTSIRLAPGWRWMLTMIAGVSPIHAAWRMFSAPSITSATSESRRGALLR